MSRPTIALDISPLSELHHTGIANVTKSLAKELLGDVSTEGIFVFNRSEIPRAWIEKLVDLDGGDILWWLAGRARLESMDSLGLDRTIIGIYPGHKWHRRLYPFEVQIVHDLTTIVTPQYHTQEAVEFWQEHLFGDMASSDLIVAVSQSTESDIRIYFPELAHIPSIVAPLAPCTELPQSCADPHFIEPYVAILGTLEPRKNVEFVFDYLSRNRRLLESVAFVFIGRFGWGNSADQLLDRYQLRPLFEKRRVRFTGFVSDAVRDQLIANARAVVYPSRYEGFGLPVLEALACGVPVITTLNSSMPETGGTLASYFDVGNQEQFAAAVETALQETSPGSAAIRGDLVAKRKAWSARFTWRQSYLTIRDAALQALAQGSRQGPLVGESQSARAESHMRPSP